MKKSHISLSVICALLAIFSAACAGVHAVDTSQIELIRLDQLGAIDLDGDEFMKQMASGKQLLVFAAKGQTLPANTMLDFPFLKSRDGRIVLEFTQDTYLLISKAQFLISPDRQNWVAIHDAKGLKKLYGAKKGRLNIGVSADKEHGPVMELSVDLR